MKILGSFIGDDIYIKTQLEDVISDWKVIAERLINYPILQDRMLMFRYCFSTKPLHLLRNISKSLTGKFVSDFINLQISILESMFNVPITENLMKRLCLPIGCGGIGILDLHDVHGVAHIAAVFKSEAFRNDYKQAFELPPEGVGDENEAFAHMCSYVLELRQHLQEFKEYLNLPARATDGDIMDVLNKLHKLTKKEGGTLQNQLYSFRVEQRWQEIMITIGDEIDRAHFQIMQNETAGKWLMAFPKTFDYCIANSDFQINLCYRYMLKQPLIAPDTKCPFCRKGTRNNNCTVDQYGFHLNCACASEIAEAPGAQRHAIHNAMRHQTFSLCKDYMAYAVEEPQGALLGLPDGSPDDRRPADVFVAFSYKGISRHYAIDISIVCPFDGAASGKLTVADPNDLDKRANEAAERKKRKYSEACKAAGMTFVPFIIFSTGKIHKDALRFIDQLCDYASECKGVAKGILRGYFLKMISVQLVKRIGYTINTRARAIFSRNYDYRRCFRDDIARVNDSERFYLHRGNRV